MKQILSMVKADEKRTKTLFRAHKKWFLNKNSLFTFSSEPLIREKLMSGKLLIEWRHDLCGEITKKRYINDQEVMRLAHAEIVNLFFPQETSDESDEIHSETSDKSSKFSAYT